MTPLDKLNLLFIYLIELPIKFYRKFISPCLPRCCKYYPSCSVYTLRAIRKHGAVKGVILGSWRILRCNPWSKGGIDHVPEKFDLTYCFKKENNDAT